MGVNAIANGPDAVHDVALESVSSEKLPDFDTWVVARGPALLRFAYLVTRDSDTAQDAVQEALASACARWARISRTDDPEAYVRRMVANAHISWWRRFGRRESPVAEVRLDGPVDGSRLPEHDAAWQLCATLPRKQRAAVVLRFYEDRSYSEIAEILACSEVTVRSQVHRALAALRARLESEGER